MSSVKRFGFFAATDGMVEREVCGDGDYVLFTDYEAKCADYERLRDAMEWAELALEEIDEMQEANEFGLRAVARMRLAEVRATYALPPAVGSIGESDDIAAARKAKESS